MQAVAAPRRLSRAARREQLVEAALAIAARDGYQGLSFARVAERAGVTRNLVLPLLSGRPPRPLPGRGAPGGPAADRRVADRRGRPASRPAGRQPRPDHRPRRAADGRLAAASAVASIGRPGGAGDRRRLRRGPARQYLDEPAGNPGPRRPSCGSPWRASSRSPRPPSTRGAKATWLASSSSRVTGRHARRGTLATAATVET